MLISVHMPKTAGTSFTEALRAHFGDGLYLHYADRPLHQSALTRNTQALGRGLRFAAGGDNTDGIACIHGHFLPLAYRWWRSAPPPIFITWLRDPVERLASHYEHWKRVPQPPSSDVLHRRMLDEAWSFETFVFRPELRDVYAKFLWGFPAERFQFIGISEDYEKDLAWFGEHILGSRLESARTMVNPERDQARYDIDSALRRRIEAYHSQDAALYQRALAQQAERYRAA